MVIVTAGLEIFGVTHHCLAQRTASSASDRTAHLKRTLTHPTVEANPTI
jgi:hypothetical protein